MSFDDHFQPLKLHAPDVNTTLDALREFVIRMHHYNFAQVAANARTSAHASQHFACVCSV